LLALARVVGSAATHSVDSDNRQQYVVTHADTFLGGEKICRGSAEVFASLVGADRRRAGGIDHRVDPFERRVQSLARNQVNAVRAADTYHRVLVPLKECDSARTDIAGRTGYSDSRDTPPLTPPGVIAAIDLIRWELSLST
jgi:hypothetical protein